ncbi:MAG: hypothetical protein M4579_005572 [Chaenotheca gracillima]|nr:MAG: hypothetical protein M4579_005572 [Chaenotheca gracillima]
MTKKKSRKAEKDTAPSEVVSSQEPPKGNVAPPAEPVELSPKDAPAMATETPKKPFPNVCRHKHWRYLSSYHGPWLQLPSEMLITLAHGNYVSAPPHPLHAPILYDVARIRELVDQAVDLAVRAANGVSGVISYTSLSGGNGKRPGGTNARLSKERKYRMREQATQKLAKAYRLDEIATSSFVMQSPSTLEDVASLVLEKDPDNADAKYVHFFHEKIPSKRLPEFTTLTVLNEVFAKSPCNGEILRTRANTRMFKDDFPGAVKDLTEALALCRLKQNQHDNRPNQSLQSLTAEGEAALKNRPADFQPKEDSYPTGLETQLLFHRAHAYLVIACDHLEAALPPKAQEDPSEEAKAEQNVIDKDPTPPVEDEKAKQGRMEAMKIVKNNAKRALKDFIAFLSHFDYTAGISGEYQEATKRRGDEQFRKDRKARSLRGPPPNYADKDTSSAPTSMNLELIRKKPSNCSHTTWADWDPAFPMPTLYKVSTLFSSNTPVDLPSYPCTDKTMPDGCSVWHYPDPDCLDDYPEAITYHPLLTDALHSLLVCHAIIQTSTKELLRHAHMVARVARVCDGYPILVAPRSPSRSDWVEILKDTSNWIGLEQDWDTICAPSPLPAQDPRHERNQQRNAAAAAATPGERQRQDKIMASFEEGKGKSRGVATTRAETKAQRAEARDIVMQMREERLQEINTRSGYHPAKRWGQEDSKDYPHDTKRCADVARWILEAPALVGENGACGAKKAGGKKKKAKKVSPKSKANDQEEPKQPSAATAVV